ncbi:MAG TPA: hypothetical protein VJJ21_02820 [Candidatus Nanoarchaeia archaeon]|nr:hypothetical protein [Candidatus Nanoarchaeia archaeon]
MEEDEQSSLLVVELKKRTGEKRAHHVSIQEIMEVVEDFEKSFIEHGKPSLRQWIPGYGVLNAWDAADAGKPSIMEREGHFFRFYVSMLWHFGSVVGLTLGTAYFANKIIDYFQK